MIPFAVFGNTIAAQYILPHSKDKIYSITAIIAALLSVTANFVFIPKYGAMGAVISIILAESSRCIILTIVSRNELPVWVYIRNSMFFFISGAMMFFIVRLVGGHLGKTAFSVITQVIIGFVFYLGISVIYLYKSKDDVFCNLINKFRRS
jgi:O-antigen/teichoic acid export membrane protein